MNVGFMMNLVVILLLHELLKKQYTKIILSVSESFRNYSFII